MCRLRCRRAGLRERLIGLILFGVKNSLDHTEAHLVAMTEHGIGDTFAVDKRAVRRAYVVQMPLPGLKSDLGMVARNGCVLKVEFIPSEASDVELFFGKFVNGMSAIREVDLQIGHMFFLYDFRLTCGNLFGKFLKKVTRIVRARARLGMVLHAERREFFVPQTSNGAVIEVDMRDLDVVR